MRASTADKTLVEPAPEAPARLAYCILSFLSLLYRVTIMPLTRRAAFIQLYGFAFLPDLLSRRIPKVLSQHSSASNRVYLTICISRARQLGFVQAEEAFRPASNGGEKQNFSMENQWPGLDLKRLGIIRMCGKRYPYIRQNTVSMNCGAKPWRKHPAC